MTDTIEAIHDFWFGELDENGLCREQHHSLWFGARDETDTFCREHFGASLALALDGQLPSWTQTDRGLVALVVLLDQFSRNIHRVFLYLPLEHCEDLAVQETCVALFTALAKQAGHPQFDGFCRYAIAHREVIARFGRFPHRNVALGRESSAEELAYLEEHGGF